MIFSRRGSITVFICIVLAVLVPLCCILMDITRFSMAKRQAEAALKTCAESMLAAYDRQLKEQYGLFAIYPRDVSAMEQEVFELVSDNLNAETPMDGVSDLYGFKVRKVEVIPIYNLSEPFVLKQQAAEFMKYRAPVQVVQEFVEKIKVMAGLQKEAASIDKKMNVDRLMVDIRSSLVTLHHMLNDKLSQFNTSEAQAGKTLKDEKLKRIKALAGEIIQQWDQANRETKPINDAQDALINLYPGFESAERNLNDAAGIFSQIKSRFEQTESELEKARAAHGRAKTEKEKEALKLRIDRLEAELEGMREEFSRAEDVLNACQKAKTEAEAALFSHKNDIETKTTAVINNLSLALQTNNDLLKETRLLLDHIELHRMFHADLLSLIDKLEPDIAELEKQSAELFNETADDGGSVSDKIHGDLEKQLKCIKRETYTDIRKRLEDNRIQLQAWKESLIDFSENLNEEKREMESALEAVKAVQASPQNAKNRYSGFNENDNFNKALNSLDAGLASLKTLKSMQGIYEVPAYTLEPKPEKGETKAFEDWFNKKYLGIDAKTDSPSSGDGAMDQIRDHVGAFAQSAAKGDNASQTDSEDANENIPSDISLDDFSERKRGLPSVSGPLSSDFALWRIGDAIEASASNQVINESLDKPIQGLDTVNEKDRNFFNYEMQRMLELLNTVRQFVANGLESVIEDIYLNEYIVSAFKSAARDVPENDIGWGRPLDQSFFKNAEVEYILFGKPSEKANVSACKRNIFAIRLVFNLLHVYSDPQKLSASLSLATTLAGWTLFGIPVVQNFLMISWAGLESYVDTECLLKGQQVPLIKTSSSWYLGLENMADSLKNIFLKELKSFAVNRVENTVDDASEAIRETVMGLIGSKVDEAFGAIEAGVSDAMENVSEAVKAEASALFANTRLVPDDFESMDTFAVLIGKLVGGMVDRMTEKLKNKAPEVLSQYKAALMEEIETFIFASPLYTSFVDRIKSAGNDLINKGIGAIEGQVDKVLGAAGKSRSSNIAARLITMDYTDYLRLMLLAVPGEIKALRTADVMELNLQEVSTDDELSIGRYNTYVYIKAELDFNPWFLPEGLFRKKDAGMMTVEWSQGY